MERIEKFLILIVILTIISLVWSFVSTALISRVYGPTFAEITAYKKIIVILILVPKALVCLCIAFWLYLLAKQYNCHPFGWFIFGLFLGIMALVVFYLIRIHDMIKKEFNKA